MKRILELSKRFLAHELVSGSMYIFVGYLIASFMNFALNLFLARRLIASDYGIYASMLSLFTLASIPTQSLTAIIVRFATGFFAKNQFSYASNFYFKTYKFVFILSIVLVSLFLFFAGSIKNFLNITDSLYIILVGLAVGASYLAIVNLAFLQGYLKFSFISLSYVIGGAVRLFAGVFLVIMGFKVFGALWAILIAILIPFLIQFFPLRILIKTKSKEENVVTNKEIFVYAFPTFVAIVSLMSFTLTDVILAKHFFSPNIAGLYGGLSLIGKVIFYFTGPISSVMFPLLIKRHNLDQNINNLLYVSVFLVAFPSALITFAYFLDPNLIVRLFLGGGDYLKIAPYLGFFGIFLIIFSVLNVFTNFFLSLRKTQISVFIFVTAILQVILINYFHANFFEIILSSISSSGILLIILVIYFIKEYGRKEKFITPVPAVGVPSA